MKMAIILGVLQMIFGVFLKGFNTIFMRNKIDFFFEFVPQIVFIVSLFGWMAALIVIKWTVQTPDPLGEFNANLITTLINLGLALGAVEKGPNETAIMEPTFQSTVQF